MIAIGVRSLEDFLEEEAFELSLEDARKRVRFGGLERANERLVQLRIQR